MTIMTVRIPIEGKLVCHSQHNFNVVMIFASAVHPSAYLNISPSAWVQKLRAFHMFNYQLHGCVLFLSGSRPSIYCRVLFSVRLPAPGIEPGSSSSRGASLSYYAMAAGHLCTVHTCLLCHTDNRITMYINLA